MSTLKWFLLPDVTIAKRYWDVDRPFTYRLIVYTDLSSTSYSCGFWRLNTIELEEVSH